MVDFIKCLECDSFVGFFSVFKKNVVSIKIPLYLVSAKSLNTKEFFDEGP